MTILVPDSVVPSRRTEGSGDTVVLGEVRRGLTDASDGCRDLDAVLDAARAAERAGAACVVVPVPDVHSPVTRHWPTTAQALAVLLATSRVRVVVEVHTSAWTPDALARFAAGATRLAGDRLTVEVYGDGAARFADRMRTQWTGTVIDSVHSASGLATVA